MQAVKNIRILDSKLDKKLANTQLSDCKQAFIDRTKTLLHAVIAQKQYLKDCQIDKFNHYYSIVKKDNDSKTSLLPYIDIKRLKFKDFHTNKQRIFAMNHILMQNDDYIPLFTTITLKGQYSAFKKEDIIVDGKIYKQDTPNWSDFDYTGFSANDLKIKVEKSYNELGKVNRRVCQYINKLTNNDFHYFTVFEPTKISTFHSHSIFYIKKEHLSQVQTYLNKALSKVGRFEVKPLLKNDNQVVANYVLKYVGKSFDKTNSFLLGLYLLSKFRIFRTSNTNNLGLLNTTDYKAIYKQLKQDSLTPFKQELIETATINNTNLFIEISKNTAISNILNDCGGNLNSIASIRNQDASNRLEYDSINNLNSIEPIINQDENEPIVGNYTANTNSKNKRIQIIKGKASTKDLLEQKRTFKALIKGLKFDYANTNKTIYDFKRNLLIEEYGYIKEFVKLSKDRRLEYLTYFNSLNIPSKQTLASIFEMIEKNEDYNGHIKYLNTELSNLQLEIQERLKGNIYQIVIDNNLVYDNKSATLKPKNNRASFYKQDSYIEHRYFMNLIDSVYKIKQSKFNNLTKEQYLDNREAAYNSALVGFGAVLDF